MIEIARVGPDAGPLLRDLRLAALADSPSAFGSTLDAEARYSDADWRERAVRASSGDEVATFVAVDRVASTAVSAPVGLVGAGRRPAGSATIELFSMWVAPEGRLRGTGRRLVETVISWATGAGATQLELWVTTGNEAAGALYRSCGFREIGDHQAHPSDPCLTETRMARPLAAPAERH